MSFLTGKVGWFAPTKLGSKGGGGGGNCDPVSSAKFQQTSCVPLTPHESK